MANTVEVVGGLGDATDSEVLSGTTYTSDNGIKRTGTFVPSAENITFDNTDTSLEASNVQDAIKEVVENINIDVDTTLSVSGAAADSKTVGDIVGDINNALATICGNVAETLDTINGEVV